jgi:hypothetical protein
MSATKLTEIQLVALRPLEAALQQAVQNVEPDVAVQVVSQIQGLFPNDRSHHRLLRAKLWAFEAVLEANRVMSAEAGFVGIRKLSEPSTRLYLEASALLAVCKLRQKKIPEAKTLISEVISKINNITSERTRRQFQQRLIERVEEECVLTELIGSGNVKLDVNEIDAKARLLAQHPDEEILKLIGDNVPAASVQLLHEVRTHSIKQLPAPDRKLLPPPEKAEEPSQIGRTTFALLKRIAWKTFCKPSSPIYKLWSNRVPKVFNEGYFSAAVVTTLGDLRIGIPMIASGLAALVMKYTAEEFCELAKPKGLMIPKKGPEA